LELGTEMSQSFDAVLDVQGEICPYPDIRTRKKLKEMKPGQILKVIVDYPMSVERIPRNVTAEGHRVLAVQRVNGPIHELYIQVGETKHQG
jgi:tRNA 2-thiouridine synthesizing protein A